MLAQNQDNVVEWVRQPGRMVVNGGYYWSPLVPISCQWRLLLSIVTCSHQRQYSDIYLQKIISSVISINPRVEHFKC